MKETQLLLDFARPDPPAPHAEEREGPQTNWFDKEAQYKNRHFGVSADPAWNRFQRIWKQTGYDVTRALQIVHDLEGEQRKEVHRARRDHL